MGHLSTSERVSTTLSPTSSITPPASDDDSPNSGAGSTTSAGNGAAVMTANGGGGSIMYKRNGSAKTQLVDDASAAATSSAAAASPTTALTPLELRREEYAGPAHNIVLEDYTRDFKGDNVLGVQFKAPLKWDKVIQISLLHIVAIVCFLGYPLDKLTFPTLAWSFFTGGVAGFGVTAGAHRYWTHRSYKANLPLRIIMMLCFSLAGQNTMYDWVRDHRVHHKFSETDADPHNSNRGFFFAHVGWLMMLKHPEVLRRGRQIDMSDVLADPVIQFHQKYFIPLKTMLCFVIPTLIPIYCWGEVWYLSVMQQCLFRYVSSLNFTWLVNSAAHMWGTRPYDKRIMPVENIYVSILAMGEGWHNYHHVFPWDYKAAELGKYTVNFSTMVLDMFHKIGWAWNMKEPSKELIRRTIEKYGDGSHDSAHKDHGHCHYPEVPDPEFASASNAAGSEEDDAESSSTESTKLDENENLKNKKILT